jgi:hypothetical protein
MLETLAEELPPLLPRAKGVNGGSTKQAAAKVATPPSPSAFEMEAELTQVAAVLNFTLTPNGQGYAAEDSTPETVWQIISTIHTNQTLKSPANVAKDSRPKHG